MTPGARERLPGAVTASFREAFGDGAPRCFFAPGRINVCGAHLDYSGGDVLPMAVDRGIYAAVKVRSDGRIRLRSLDQELAVEVDVAALGDRTRPEWGWAGYPLGVVRELRREHPGVGGFDVVFVGDLPMESGLSSSAAIEVVTAIALDALHGLGLDRERLASLAHRAENEFVGVRCGIMDQYASALARPGKALLVHCAGPRWEHVPFDPDRCEVLVMDTKKPRALAESGFNDRVAECAAAREVLCARVEERPHLALFSPDELEACRGAMPENLYLRARHVVTEMGRIAAGVAALRRGDYRGLGEQIDLSHRSTATDYDVSCAELDVITDAARERDEVYGARLTGAGFGGCAIALIEPGAADDVSAHVRDVFSRRFGVEPAFDLLRAGPGPGEVHA